MRALGATAFAMSMLFLAGAAWAQEPDPRQVACTTTSAVASSQRALALRDIARREYGVFQRATVREYSTGFIDTGEAQVRPWEQIRNYFQVSGTSGSLFVTIRENDNIPLDPLLPQIGQGLAPNDAREAVTNSVYRAAVRDTPWSAAFISSMMVGAVFTADQFTFGAGHWQYINAAVTRGHEADTTYAYIGCSPEWVRPRVGDLICYDASERGDSPQNFASVIERANLGRSYPAHCDLVTEAGANSSIIRSIGGNVSDSVKQSRWELSSSTSTLSTNTAQTWIAVLMLARP
jgi:hypothetical protein